MIEAIKNQLWETLKEKSVSLAMIYNKEGEILWQRGRHITGNNVLTGDGYSKSLINQSLQKKAIIKEDNVSISVLTDDMPNSAIKFRIKSIFIHPLENDLYLYLDSGTNTGFSQAEKEVFKAQGALLSKIISSIRQQENSKRGISGSSPLIKELRDTVLKYSIVEDPILLLGESGSGKTHIAELIHAYSGRDGRFVTINTPSIPANLFESEVFGHKKGAFTDARSDKPGLVEEAQNGTLFFDEIAEVPISFQIKLLRFIESKRYFVLGDNKEKEADVRLITATNVDLKKAIAEKTFRSDLYFRLNVLELRIPSLRERKEDISALVLERIKTLKGKELSADFWQAMLAYDWPGNIRELITVLIRLGIHGSSPITGDDVRQVLHQSSIHNPNPTPAVSIPDNTHGDEQIKKALQRIEAGEDFWQAIKTPFLNRDLNRDQVRTIILQKFAACQEKYIELLPLFNLNKNQYTQFMSFLKNNDLKLK